MEVGEPCQDREVAALSTCCLCGGFIMKNFDEYFMSVAIEEAKMAFSEDEIPVGCVLVCNNEIIARGHNYRKHDNLVISHAEINAILQANRKLQNYILSDCVLYVTLEPCSMCIGAIQQAHIKRVVYGAKDEKAGALGCFIKGRNVFIDKIIIKF